jgi:DNA-directed RNA polymerase specialized sigma24 family protein
MKINPLPNDNETDEFIQSLILNEDIQLFTKKLIPNDTGEKVRLETSTMLQSKIKSRLESIIIENPEFGNSESAIVKQLVWDLVDDREKDLTRKHWESFFLAIGKRVATNKWSRYSNRINYLDFQDHCLNVVNNFVEQIPIYRTTETNLLSRVKAYAYGTVKNSLFERLRKELNDPTIGRSNKYLAVNFSNKKIKAGLESSNFDKIDVDKYLDLRKSVKEHLRRERQTNEDRKIKVNKLEPKDLEEISKLYQKITGNESPPILETLELIGQAVRLYEQNPLPEPPPPEPKRLPLKMLVEQCNCWFSNEGKNLKPRDLQIFYLHYRFHLNQGKIAPIFHITQGNISRPLSKIRAGITNHTLAYLSDFAQTREGAISSEDRSNMTRIAESVIKDIKSNFDRLNISQQVNDESRLILELLIQEYEKYFNYLEMLYTEYPKLLSNLTKSDRYEYERQLQNLETLRQEEYPKLNLHLDRYSFLILIEEIANVLDRLWN